MQNTERKQKDVEDNFNKSVEEANKTLDSIHKDSRRK